MSESRVFLRDCMEGMKEFPDKYFDLAIVDPPYGIGEDGRNHLGRNFRKNGSAVIKTDPRNGVKYKIKKPAYKLTARYDDAPPDQSYFDELFRVSSKLIIWGENYIPFDQRILSSGRIIWDKVNGDTDQSDCETAWTNCHKSVRKFTYMWNGMLQGKSLTEGHINQGNKALCEDRIHPNHKPIILYKWLLKNYTKPGDKILDTHLGSGSSRIAAYDLGLDFTGYEIDKDYFEAQEKRFNQFKSQTKLFATNN